MADYKGIHGGKVQNFSTNPPAPIAGQVWYNETTATINYFSSNPTGSWAAGNNMNTARRQIAGAGIQTSALVFGGYSTAKEDKAESYNGTNWTEVGDLNTERSLLAGCGASNTSALAFGGLLAPPEAVDETESWNGTSWTEVADLNTGRWVLAAAGISTSALAFGGQPGSGITGDTESWNGSTWTEVANLNTDRSNHGGLGANNTAVLCFGGTDELTAATEKWNGTSWAEVNDLNTARAGTLRGAGTTTAGLAFGGYTTAASASTEEWNEPVEATKSVDTD